MTMAGDSFEELSEELRAAYASGDKRALLQAIHLAIAHRRPQTLLADEPAAALAWAAQAFDEAYTRVMMGGARSWNAVFGDPHHGTHQRTAQQENRDFEVYWRVQKLHDRKCRGKNIPLDDRLFEHVGKRTGIGRKTVVKKLYYRVKRALRRLGDEEIWELMLTAMDAGPSGK